MRLLLLTEYFPPHAGGTAVYYYEVMRRLSSTDITVVTRAHARAMDFDPRQPFSVVRTPFPPIPKVRMVVEWWAQFLVGLWIVFSRRVDVVHGGQVFPLGLAVYGIHLLSRIPYAIFIHGEEITNAVRNRWKRAAVRFVLGHSDAVFVNSWFSATQISMLGVPQSRIHVVHPGVDHVRFRPMDGSALPSQLGHAGRHILLSVGRLVPRKGQDTMIRLLPRIAAAVPDVEYWIAGGGSLAERRRLERLTALVGMCDRVRFLGEVPERDLPTLYAACDVFVMLNRATPDGDVEGFGIVFLEASACGKPVIGGRSGGAVEAVRNGQTGLLIPAEDADTAVAAIIRLLRDAELRRRLGAAGRRRAIRSFSWDQTARRVTRVSVGLVRWSRAGSDSGSEGGRVLASWQ